MAALRAVHSALPLSRQHLRSIARP